MASAATGGTSVVVTVPAGNSVGTAPAGGAKPAPATSSGAAEAVKHKPRWKMFGAFKTKPVEAGSVALTQITSKVQLGAQKHLGAAENEAVAAEIEAGRDPRRVIRIGFTLLSIDTIDDVTNQFHCNFLLHCKWFHKEGEEWHPWLQWKNAYDVGELDVPGAEKIDKDTPEGMVLESTHVVGTFAKTLDLRCFPFDVQEITLILVSNSTKDAVLSFITPFSIKSNFEYEVCSEWIIVRDQATGNALSWFSFEGADPKLSAQGAAYNNFIFNILVARNPWAVTLSTVLSSTLLALACLVSYSLDINQGPANRFSVVFTVVLTLVTNQIMTQGRLPVLPYYTFIDYYLLAMTLTCYGIGVEATYVTIYVKYYSLPGHEESDAYFYDIRGFWVSLGLLLGFCFAFYARGYMFIRRRHALEREARKKAKLCREGWRKPKKV